ncbi:MAG: cysteine--tRNA ligase [Chloroflexi bacterium]|nr:cysteine--tRNA ligase [Chloroflexota bacterium]
MRLTNTLTGAVDDLVPLEAGRLGIYVCGVTPYAESHVGHAMAAIVYDVLVRYLRWPGNAAGGYDVTFVSNYTDVDDNVIARAAEVGRDPLELVAENIDEWEEQQRALNLVFPDVRPRVTTHIETIIAATEAIVERGFGYATEAGDVYFRVRAKPDYGKLSHRDIDQLRSGTRFEPGEGKEFPLDFALWKATKPGEPSWPSPWGPGRPGWHIECSAMSQHYLGEAFDVHGGGVDLVFPHHENEIAQAEAATGTFARHWLHNGLVQRDGEKMSKSIGNVVTVADALQRWRADALRLFVLGSHYRSPANLTDEALAAAESGVDRLLSALRGAPAGSGEPVDPSPERARFVDALEDDLGTPQALAAVFDLARSVNRGRDAGRDARAAQAALAELTRDVLGLRLEAPDAVGVLDVVALSKLASKHGVSCGGSDAESTIEALLAARTDARAERDFARADAIRSDLADAGVEVADTPEGPRWSAGR